MNRYISIDFDMNSIIFIFDNAPECVAMTFPPLNIAKRGNPWILYLSTVSSCTSVSTVTNLISDSENSSDTLENTGATAGGCQENEKKQMESFIAYISDRKKRSIYEENKGEVSTFTWATPILFMRACSKMRDKENIKIDGTDRFSDR